MKDIITAVQARGLAEKVAPPYMEKVIVCLGEGIEIAAKNGRYHYYMEGTVYREDKEYFQKMLAHLGYNWESEYSMASDGYIYNVKWGII